MATPLNYKNLKINQDITLLNKGSCGGKCGFDGSPMKFLGASYPLIFVSVDTLCMGRYDFNTSYDLREKDILPVPKHFLAKTQKQK